MCAPQSELLKDVHGVIQRREEKREKGDRGGQEDKNGGIKRGQSKLASYHFLMCAPESAPLRDVHGVIQRREEGGRRQKWPGG